MVIASFGEKLKSIYARWAPYLDMLGRLAAACAAYFWIRYVLGFGTVFTGIPLLVIAALLASVLGSGSMLLFGGVLIAGQAFSLSPEAGAFASVVLLITAFLFIRLVPEESIAVLIMPVFIFFGLPALIPVFLGLKRKPFSAFAAVSGVIVFYLCAALESAAPALSTVSSSDYAGRLQILAEHFGVNGIVVTSLAAAATVIAVYAVRRMPFSFAFETSIILGGLVWILFFIIGNTVIGTEFDLLSVAAGSAASCIIALIMQLLFLQLDFKRAKSLRFEDDDYYYYVKAVPKVTGQVDQELEIDFEEDDFDEIRVAPDAAERPKIDHDELERRLTDSLRDL